MTETPSTKYNIYLSPPELFVGTKYQENDNESYWERESNDYILENIKTCLERLGINVIEIELGDYDMLEGTIRFSKIIGEFSGTEEVLTRLLYDEEYIITETLKSYSFQSGEIYIGVYFKPLI